MMDVIVLTLCVCVSVPLAIQAEQTDIQPEFLAGGQVEGYLGQVNRSR